MKVIGLHPANEPGALVVDFREQTGVTFRLAPDELDTLSQFSFPDGVSGAPYPRDVVVDKDLVVRSIKSSFNPLETQELIDQLLAE
ncbi:MAG: hypothetical protein KTR31_29215 [Myxococcales bacterium]|nr:hypothetical protein [Myxococcales bacterium]